MKKLFTPFLGVLLVVTLLITSPITGSYALNVTQTDVTNTDILQLGDLNIDQKINAKDALLVLKISVGKTIPTEAQKTAANVNKDNNINAKDALEILKYSVGKPSALDKAFTTITLASSTPTHYTQGNTGKIYQAAFMQSGMQTNVISCSDSEKEIANELLIGAKADVYSLDLHTARRLAKRNLLANVREIEGLNASLFHENLGEAATFANKQYALGFAGEIQNSNVLFYNQSIVNQYASQYNISQMYQEKTWNFTTFETILDLCTVVNNNKTEIYGLLGDKGLIDMALHAQGVAAEKNAQGIQPLVCTDTGIATLTWCKNLFKEKRVWNIQPNSDTFIQGKAAFYVADVSQYAQLTAQADFDIGLTAMPLGNNQTQYANGVYYAQNLLVVPKSNANRFQEIGEWLNAVATAAEPLVEYQGKTISDLGLDTQSVEIYKQTLNNASPEYLLYALEPSTRETIYTCVTQSVGNPKKQMETIAPQMKQELTDYYDPFFVE